VHGDCQFRFFFSKTYGGLFKLEELRGIKLVLAIGIFLNF
jgi:hypothetical protein